MSDLDVQIDVCTSSRCHDLALDLLAQGLGVSQVGWTLGIDRSTVRRWRDHPEAGCRHECPQCDGARLDGVAYARLLGFYLGDGCISRAARCHVLRVSCDAKYPTIIESVADAILGVRPGANVFRVPGPGVTIVQASWVHWPCLFPQDGDGPKHRRKLVLADWQASIVEGHPAPFLQGLFHSDGCRATNVVVAPATQKAYSYARWQFGNRSQDIHAMCQWALDLAGIDWKRTGWHTCVSKRDAVARLDELIGLKT